MKKIFAICAVAFVAAAMFTSCNKPEENTVTVKFNKEQWTAGEVLGNVQDSKLGMEAYETSFSDRNCAEVFGTLGTTTGNFNNYKFYYVANADDVDADGNANWGVDSHSQEITAIDLAAQTIDAEVVETLKKGEESADLKITMNNALWVTDTAVLIEAKGMAKRR